MNKTQFKEIAISLKLIPTEKVLNSLHKEFDRIEKSLNLLKTINIENIKPLEYINEKQIFNTLREDKVSNNKELLSQKEILSNANTIYHDYIVIPKVVK